MKRDKKIKCKILSKKVQRRQLNLVLFYKESIANLYGCNYSLEDGFTFGGWNEKLSDEELEKIK